ncbi:MAG: flagellar basal body P-ring formation chaperone FlgA [Phycisphaerae bacterium]
MSKFSKRRNNQATADNIRTPRDKRGAGRLVAIAAFAFVELTLPAVADADDAPRLSLRTNAHVFTHEVVLSDILVARGASDDLRTTLEKTRVTLPDGMIKKHTVGYRDAAKLLQDAGVNLGDVLFSGARECTITFESLQTDSAGDPATSRNTDNSAITITKSAAGTQSLADLLTQHVQREYRDADATISLDFEQAGGEFLRLTTPPFDFTIRGGQKTNSGVRQFHVTVSRDGTRQRTVEIFARVQLEVPVVIATAPLSVGTYLRRDDFRVEKRTFPESDKHEQIVPDALVGQRLKRFIDRGDMVQADDLKPEPLVRRSRPVTVHNNTSGVSMRLTGVALDNGMLGDTIRVRIGANHGQRREVRAVVKGVCAVEVAGG